jgi:GxxExxY protein
MPQEPTSELTGQVIGCAMTVHRTLGNGYNESVYHKALEIELNEVGIRFESRKKLQVLYKNNPVGDFEADLVIDGLLIVELKAVQTLLPVHEAQLVNYLTTTGLNQGLLINFGAESLQFKKKFRTYRPRVEPSDSQNS